jgi:hypothetical protein
MLEKLSVEFEVVGRLAVYVFESYTMHRVAPNRIIRGVERTIMSS